MAITSRAFRVCCATIAVVSVLIAMFVRIRFLDFPLERDEGEYAYAGQLLLRAIPPYQLAYNMKFPGTYFAYAVIMAVFGESTAAIHFGLLLVNLATILCLFIIGRTLATIEAGLLAAGFYAVLSVSPWVAGLCAHATHFVVLPVLIGTAILLRRNATAWTSSVAGALFGIAILMKQPGALFLPLGCVAIALSRRNERRRIASGLVIFLSAAAAVIALMLIALAIAGTLGRFRYWAIDYASAYGTLISPAEGLRLLRPLIPQIIGGDWLIWTVAIGGTIAAAILRRFWPHRAILLALLFCSVAAVCPGFYFREHYFILLLPAIALTAAATLNSLATRSVARIGVIVAAIVCIAFPLYRDRELLFRASPLAVSRSLYWPSPFADARQVSDFVRARTASNDTIAVLGSEPEIYFYANRRSATGYIYTYALMEPQAHASEMQREMISEIERAMPKILVVIGSDASWLRRPSSDETIFHWANDYCAAHYSVAGLVNVVSPERSDYFLPLDNSAAPPALAANYVLVYERRAATGP